MNGVLLRSVLVAALSDGGKELLGFIDDLFPSGMFGRFTVSEYGWDDRWLTKSTNVYMPVQGSWASCYAERLGFWGHSLLAPFTYEDMVGIYI